MTEVLPRFTTDALMRRDTAVATKDTVLWKLSKHDLMAVLGSFSRIRTEFFKLDEKYEATLTASKR